MWLGSPGGTAPSWAFLFLSLSPFFSRPPLCFLLHGALGEVRHLGSSSSCSNPLLGVGVQSSDGRAAALCSDACSRLGASFARVPRIPSSAPAWRAGASGADLARRLTGALRACSRARSSPSPSPSPSPSARPRCARRNRLRRALLRARRDGARPGRPLRVQASRATTFALQPPLGVGVQSSGSRPLRL